MVKEEPEDDAPPIYKHPSSKKLKAKGQQEAKKGDTVKGKDLSSGASEDDSEWESIGEKYLDEKNEIKGDVDEDELKGTAKQDPATGKMKLEGKGWDDIRAKDSEGGRRREYFKRKQPPPTS